MKIAIDCLSAKSLYHGMGVYLNNLLRYLIPLAQNHSFLLFGRLRTFQCSDDFLNTKNVDFREIRLNRSFRILWENTLLPVDLIKERVDLFWGPSNFLPPLKVCKYIVTIHDISSFIFARTYPWLRRNYYQVSIRNALHRADGIISVSSATKNDLIKYFPISEDKIRVIPNGVGEMFQSIISPKEILRVREKYHLPSEFLLSLGVLEPKKNTERIILAYARLKEEIANLPKLVIAGSRAYGWKNSSLFQLIKRLKLEEQVLFPDKIEQKDLPAVYHSALLFLYPSLYEGFGLPVVEAMACGTPVITSNVSSLPEVAGDAAILVNPYSVSEIAQAMKEVLLNDRKREEMREKGIKNAQRFSWQKSAQELLNFFEEVMGK